MIFHSGTYNNKHLKKRTNDQPNKNIYWFNLEEQQHETAASSTHIYLILSLNSKSL